MSMPHQPDDLLAALRAARPDPGYQPSPASPEAVALLARITAPAREAERLRPRRLPRRLVLAGIPAIAGAAAAGGIVVATTRPAGPDRSLPSPAAALPVTALPGAATVRAAILDAFQQASGDILAAVRSLHVAETTFTMRGWRYPMFPQVDQQVRLRRSQFQDGRPVMDDEFTYIQPEPNAGRPPAGMAFAVNYQDRTWFRGQAPVIPVAVGVGLSPDQVRDDIASRMFRVTGTAELDGRRALKLQFFAPAATAPGMDLLWVDATTYVPLQSANTVTSPAGKTLVSNTVRYQVLPATQVNLALLTPTVPAGFTRTTKPPFG